MINTGGDIGFRANVDDLEECATECAGNSDVGTLYMLVGLGGAANTVPAPGSGYTAVCACATVLQNPGDTASLGPEDFTG